MTLPLEELGLLFLLILPLLEDLLLESEEAGRDEDELCGRTYSELERVRRLVLGEV